MLPSNLEAITAAALRSAVAPKVGERKVALMLECKRFHI